MNLKRIRLKYNWSQDQLAEISGVSTRTIQRLENGHPPSMETLKALAAGFNMSVDQLKEKLAPGQPESTPTGDEEIAAPIRDWKGFIVHTIIFMSVITWLLVLRQYFGIDQEIIGSVAFIWGTALAFHLTKTVAKVTREPQAD